MSTPASIVVAAICMAAFTAALAQDKTAANTKADAAWQKVDDAMNAIRKPKERPKSKEEAAKLYKEALPNFDAAFASFVAENPKDARRWEGRMFEGLTGPAREMASLPAKGTIVPIMKEIVAAADANMELKGTASAICVLEGADEAETSGKTAEWVKEAEAHLKAYPDVKYNTSITNKIETQRKMAELRTKPLDIKFTATDGTEVNLEKMRGKVVLIDFWATWCGPCIVELPNVIAAYDKLHAKGFEIVGISLDSDRAKLDDFVKEKGMKWPQHFDGKGWKNEISSGFGIRSIPAIWLVGKDGMIVSSSVRGRLEEAVEAALEK